jgi:nitric oxide reductase large subunit
VSSSQVFSLTFLVAVIGHIGDWTSTALVLGAGGWEMNPDVRAMLELGGFALFGVFKVALLLTMFVLGLMLSRLGPQGQKIAVSAFLLSAIPGIGITVHNLTVYANLVHP